MIQPKEQDEDNKKGNKKENSLKWQMISQQILKPQGLFFLEGTIFIDLNKNQLQSHVSNINYFQQMSSSVILRELGILYMNLELTTKQFDSFDTIIPLLKKQDNIHLQELADTFIVHSELLRVNRKIKQMIKNIVLYNKQLRLMIIQKRKKYEDFRREKIQSIPKDKYVCFIDFAHDYDNSEMKVIGSGMNEALIKLYGCDLESMQAISLRKGILNFLQDDSNWKLLNKLLSHNPTSFKDQMIYQTNVNIITLDEISVNVDLKITMDFCQTGDAFEGYLHPEYQKFAYDRGIIFFEHQITDFQIQKINAIRKQFILGKHNDFDQAYYRPHLLTQSDMQQSHIINQSPSPSLIQYNDSNKTLEVESTSVQAFKPIESQLINVLNPCSNGTIQNLINDVSYSIYSQTFLEKFYSSQPPKQIQPISKTISKKKKEKLCGFRLIKQ